MEVLYVVGTERGLGKKFIAVTDPKEAREGYNIMLSTDKSLSQILRILKDYLKDDSSVYLETTFLEGDKQIVEIRQDLEIAPDKFYGDRGDLEQRYTNGQVTGETFDSRPLKLKDLKENIAVLDSKESIFLRVMQDDSAISNFWYEKSPKEKYTTPYRTYFVVSVSKHDEMLLNVLKNTMNFDAKDEDINWLRQRFNK